jgi:hypothetical protein
MAILKYSYLSLGVILYIGINYISYTHVAYQADLGMKLMFSALSLLFLSLDYLAILFTQKVFRKEFKDFTTYIKVTLYLGIVIAPLISLYYT